MKLSFRGEVIFWRGPAPWYYVEVPDKESGRLKAASAALTYGWGCIPVTATLGSTTWTTSLFPRQGRYMVPLKTWVRNAEGIDLEDVVKLTLLAGE